MVGVSLPEKYQIFLDCANKYSIWARQVDLGRVHLDDYKDVRKLDGRQWELRAEVSFVPDDYVVSSERFVYQIQASKQTHP